MICAAHKMYSGDHIKKEAMGRLYGWCGGRGEIWAGLWWGDLKERDHLVDLGLEGRGILN